MEVQRWRPRKMLLLECIKITGEEERYTFEYCNPCHDEVAICRIIRIAGFVKVEEVHVPVAEKEKAADRLKSTDFKKEALSVATQVSL